MGNKPKTKYRAVWLSDIHLGTKACRVDRLVAFLQSISCEYLYLVGDVIDLWSLKRKWYWPTSHSDVIRRLLKRDVKGTKIVFVPGNHDELFREYNGLHFGGVEVSNVAYHTTADGKRVMMVHGDMFDAIVKNYTLITHLGDWAYDWLLAINIGLNAIRRRLGWGYWSLAAYVKRRVKKMITFVSGYEQSVAKYARQHKADIIICGHIHRPDLREIDGVMYGNCGDWVESCSALVEHMDGRIELLHFGMHADDGSERLPHIDEHAEAQLEVTGVAHSEALARLSMEFAADLTASGEHRAVFDEFTEPRPSAESDVHTATSKDSAGDLVAVGD
ncbi:MAG: UDP-2,3-diacylglucosamine diphosphatase [Planctomycetes bacterium]|nr:UDP-2,3-diacylglucosamine diphosphatase [Planctomycetota bacterium]